MNNSDFLKKTNISTLWDVISDEAMFKFLSKENQITVSEIFINNITGFFEVERKNLPNLMELNKKYVMHVLNFIKTKFSQKNSHNKIKIFDETPVKELITYEEIKNDKKTQFEKDLAKRQEEFTNSIAVKVPEVPDFTDKYQEIPISEMDKIIKEMTAKRNYEVEEINRSYQSDINNTNNWLKPQETSIKSEKITGQHNAEFTQQNQNYIKSKYVNTMIESPSKKNVSWGENEEINSFSSEENELETNLFKKLKKVTKEENPENNINLTIEENTLINNTNQDRILVLENDIKVLNTKLDMIITLLKK